MLSNLYLLNFNNYYNRQVKGAKFALSDYTDFIVYGPDEANTYNLTNVNFNPADGIDAAQVVNTPNSDFDYLVVVNTYGEIESRWFVIQATRSLQGQYILALHRDLIVDCFEAVVAAPAYIERAMLNVSDRLIFNSENMGFNQIKTKEILLKDKSKTPWIVGYLANNYTSISEEVLPIATDKNAYVKAATDEERQPAYSASYVELSQLGTITSGATINNQTAYSYVLHGSDVYRFIEGGGNPKGFSYIGASTTAYKTNWRANGDATALLGSFSTYFKQADNFFVGINRIKSYVPNFHKDISTYKKYAGAALLNTDYIEGQEAIYGPKYFYLKMEPTGASVTEFYLPVGSQEYNEFKQHLQTIAAAAPAISGSYFSWLTDTSNSQTFKISFPSETYECSVSAAPTELSLQVPMFYKDGSSTLPKQSLRDAPYIMFCAPYNDTPIVGFDEEWTSVGVATRNICAQISQIFGGSGATSYIYDLQLLPYCPVPQILNDEGAVDLTLWPNITTSQYSYITEENTSSKIGLLLFPPTSSFSFTIELDEPITTPTNAIEFKIQNETTKCRLVSPNYAGAFEFTPTKNGGLSAIEVNCTYKPFQPYIHLNPVFNTGFLYGGDYNDNRGLVCGGDFSLPQVSNAWINYQTQNRSYREAYNRQIENMETTYNIQREQQVTAGTVGVISAAISGASSGALAGGTAFGTAGGAIGALIGGTVGAAASKAGLDADLKAADALYRESRAYTKDQFNLSLQNIQALPDTMSRTSAFDINNKLFPFIEIYTATEREREALRQKLIYSSMSVMAIGTIADYIQEQPHYVSAQLIRLDGVGEDYHYITAIAAELHKGIYI